MAVQADTLLILTGMGVPIYSARGLTQEIIQFGASAQIRESINGTTYDVSRPQSRKYETTITCNDMRVPAADGVWPGMEVTMECVAELCYPDGGIQQRPDVTDSLYSQNGFTFYRPILSVMLVEPISWQTDEWNATVGWKMKFREVANVDLDSNASF